jgi:hypothetical protein
MALLQSLVGVNQDHGRMITGMPSTHLSRCPGTTCPRPGSVQCGSRALARQLPAPAPGRERQCRACAGTHKQDKGSLEADATEKPVLLTKALR